MKIQMLGLLAIAGVAGAGVCTLVPAAIAAAKPVPAAAAVSKPDLPTKPELAKPDMAPAAQPGMAKPDAVTPDLPSTPVGPGTSAAPAVPASASTPVKPAKPDVGPTSPPSAQSKPAKTVEPTAAAKPKTIVDIAASGEQFQTLAAAIKAAGLVEALGSDGPFTVFAPTDAAFAALPKGTLDQLLLPENKDTLIKLLSYHVVPGSLLSKDLKSGAVKTAEGSPVTLKVAAGKVMVNQAHVTTADIKASNGVVHVVDQVILPPMPAASTAPVTPSGSSPAAKPTTKPVDKSDKKSDLPQQTPQAGTLPTTPDMVKPAAAAQPVAPAAAKPMAPAAAQPVAPAVVK